PASRLPNAAYCWLTGEGGQILPVPATAVNGSAAPQRASLPAARPLAARAASARDAKASYAVLTKCPMTKDEGRKNDEGRRTKEKRQPLTGPGFGLRHSSFPRPSSFGIRHWFVGRLGLLLRRLHAHRRGIGTIVQTKQQAVVAGQEQPIGPFIADGHD